jgi:putative sigma-54 modulation protein
MNIIIKGKQIEVSDQINEYVIKRISKLETFFADKDVKKVEVIISRESYKAKDLMWKVQTTVYLLGKTVLRAEQKQQNVNAAIDEAVEKLEKQIDRYKNKLHSKVKRETSKSATMNEITSGYEDFAFFETNLANEVIEKRKEFELESMFPDEAVERMTLLQHNFFLFTNKESGKIAVVYERDAGKYGLLEPTPTEKTS